jgi:hypothetical protein
VSDCTLTHRASLLYSNCLTVDLSVQKLHQVRLPNAPCGYARVVGMSKRALLRRAFRLSPGTCKARLLVVVDACLWDSYPPKAPSAGGVGDIQPGSFKQHSFYADLVAHSKDM